jgi:hypothetical protein
VGDPTLNPRRSTLYAVVGLVAVALVIVALVIVFLRHPQSQTGCTPLTGGPPATSTGPQLNCQ